MSAAKNIQEKIGRYWLRKKAKQLNRKIKTFSLESASTVGVIYNATNRDDAETVKKFIQYLKEERKEVLSLGFIDSKDSTVLVQSHLNYTYFDQRDLTRSIVPKGDAVEKFINKPFSILIDLNKEACFPIEYISTLSLAKFKVGTKGLYHDQVCDLVINIEENKKLSFFIIQLKHYLKMIKN